MLPAIDKLLVSATSSVAEALRVIDDNAQGICFVVDSAGRLVGSLTDGDIRRSLLEGAGLDTLTERVMHRSPVTLPIESPAQVIQKALVPSISHIPLVDRENRPVDYACVSRFRKIGVAQPLLTGNELAYVTDCIQSNWISSKGPYVRRFEELFAQYVKAPHALAVSNGTVALHLALAALEIGPGDEVVVPDLTFAASINSVIYTGATPVLADIDPLTWTLDPESFKRVITPKTKAVMPVHLYGHPCRMDEIMTIAREHGLKVVEDCAEALGSCYRGRPVGSFGDASTFSFFGNKTITTGEGGMTLFADRAVAERAETLRDHGMSKARRYWHDFVGFNYRMTNLQAAIGVAQMERLDEFVASKRRIGETYARELGSLPGITLHPNQSWAYNSYWLYTVLVDPEKAGISRDQILEKLLLNGIETRPVFYPLHEMGPYRRYLREERFLSTHHVSSRGLSLPSSVTLSEQEILEVCRSLRTVCSAKRL